MGMASKAAAGVGVTIVASVGAIALHIYATCIAYHDGVVAALITLVSPPLSEIFWFGVAWHTTGTPFTLYGGGFIAVLIAYGLAHLLTREGSS